MKEAELQVRWPQEGMMGLSEVDTHGHTLMLTHSGETAEQCRRWVDLWLVSVTLHWSSLLCHYWSAWSHDQLSASSSLFHYNSFKKVRLSLCSVSTHNTTLNINATFELFVCNVSVPVCVCVCLHTVNKVKQFKQHIDLWPLWGANHSELYRDRFSVQEKLLQHWEQTSNL